MPNPGPRDGHASKASSDLGGSFTKLPTIRGLDVRGSLARDRLREKMEKRKRDEEDKDGAEKKSRKRKNQKKNKKAKNKLSSHAPSSHALLSSLLSIWSSSSSTFARHNSSVALPILASSPPSSDSWQDPHGVRTTPPALPTDLSALPKEFGEKLAAAWGHLPWKVPKKLSADYEAKMAPESSSSSSSSTMKSAMLIGDFTQWGAPISSTTCYLGLMHIGPHVAYPAHAHAAEELFHVLSGSAAWSLCSRTSMVPPGGFIRHPPAAPHGVTTGREALLCAYFWSGDLEGPYWFTEGLCGECERRPVVRCMECREEGGENDGELEEEMVARRTSAGADAVS